MTAKAQIQEFIAKIPEGESFSSHLLRPLATTDNIRQILNRLVKAGELQRVARGIYVKPKYVGRVGEVLPSPPEIAQVLSESMGETIMVQGAEAARQLQLTTQVPMQLIFYTNGNTRTLQLSNRKVKLKHVNPSRLIAPGTIPGLVISALSYIKKENTTLKTIEKIRSHISENEFEATAKLMNKMPAWMSDVFHRYLNEQKNER
jgi:hypothetical protein